MRRYSPLAFNHPPAGDHFCVAKVLLQKRKTPMWVSFFFGAGDEARTRYRHPTNGRAIRRSPAGPLDSTRFAPVEAASSSLPAAFQKENTTLTDGGSFCDYPQVLLFAPSHIARKGECEGGTFDGFPHSRSITRRSDQNRKIKFCFLFCDFASACQKSPFGLF